jgi:hypothetical protein
MDQDFVPMPPEGEPVENAPASADPSTGANRGRTIKAAALGSIVAGGIAVAAIVGPLAAQAASPSPAASTVPTPSGEPPATGGGRGGHGGGMGGFGFNPNEAVSDTSVVAKAIGISEADLKTALASGQTVAAVAKAHNVDTQVVIDALVQDGLDELAAQVAAGTITQAQADARKAEVTQRATDQVNGTFTGGGRGGRGGHGGGMGGLGGPGRNDAAPSASPITSG